MSKKRNKPPENLEQLLQEAAQRGVTPEEMKEQRVSFAMGMLSSDSKITKDEMRKLIDKQWELYPIVPERTGGLGLYPLFLALPLD